MRALRGDFAVEVAARAAFGDEETLPSGGLREWRRYRVAGSDNLQKPEAWLRSKRSRC
jgi:hypothetical protein